MNFKQFTLIYVLLGASYLFAIKPQAEYTMSPDQFKLNYVERQILTSDSAMIFTWQILPDSTNNEDCTVIFLTGDAGNMGYVLPYAYYLSKCGYQSLLFDYRGFGKSSPFQHHQ
jgi:hypothetical protein